MSGFTALNVEPDDALEEEVDDTREIQLEEAFKLYQNALKLHSQGPDSYNDAYQAYELLFQSEIFKYSEIISDFQKDQLDDTTDSVEIPGEISAETLLPTNAESAVASFPQLIYLAYKNRGQFVLDFTQNLLRIDSAAKRNADWQRKDASGKAVRDFAEALERDDTDLDLWKRAARVAGTFSSYRINRFCLESVLAGDDVEDDGGIDVSGLDEAFAADELKDMLDGLDDDLSQLQTAEVQLKGDLSRVLRIRNDPYPFLPRLEKCNESQPQIRPPLSFQPVRKVMRPSARSWLSVGETLLQVLVNEQSGTSDLGSGAAISIECPARPNSGFDLNIDARTVGCGPVSNVILDAALQETPPSNSSSSEHAPAQPQDLMESENGEIDDVLTDIEKVTIEPEQQTASADDISPSGDNPFKDSVQVEMPTSSTLNEIELPTRKRSSTTAGNEDPVEARSKSKRLRARESIMDTAQDETEVSPQLSYQYQEQLEKFALADQWMFNTLNRLFAKIGVDDIGSADELRDGLDEQQQEEQNGKVTEENPQRHNAISLSSDFKQALHTWTDEKSNAVIYGHANQDLGSGKTGLTLFLQHSKANAPEVQGSAVSADDHGLEAYVNHINQGWTSIHDAALAWLEAQILPLDVDGVSLASSYLCEKWPDDLKQVIVQLIVREDEYLFKLLQERVEAGAEKATPPEIQSYSTDRDLEMVQSLFELHLDIYSLITNPSSQVDEATRLQQRDRLSRWAHLASSAISCCDSEVHGDDKIMVRFIWSSTMFANKAEEAVKEHVLLCLEDLATLLYNMGSPIIKLMNNAAMPEISVAAVQQEISRLGTLEFFMKIFESNSSDSVEVIESLEPVLEATLAAPDSQIKQFTEVSEPGSSSPDKHQLSQHAEKMVTFLESGDASLKLFLWKRLREAYQTISYTPKIVSCYLRAIETIVSELESQRHSDSGENHRQLAMLKWLKDSDNIIAKLLGKVFDESDAFDCIDESHLRTSIRAVGRLSRLLHTFALYEDSVNVGQLLSSPMKSVASSKLFDKSKEKLREMQVRTWTLQYSLLKEATVQQRESFDRPADDLADYLRSVHNALGIRHYCRQSNKIFVKLAKTELLAIRSEEDYSADFAQILFDLYQMRFTTGVGDADHECGAETLDKKTAAQLVEMVALQASRVNVKDLIKTELRMTIDKVQQALGTVKGSPILLHNRRAITAYLRSPINPRDLYQSIKGLGDLAVKQVVGDSAAIAAHGWYFLLGHIALAKFKSVKRVNPTPTDDLDVAATFFRQDLEHGVEKWETWYRLAQVYDAKIEDDLLWTANKLNDHRNDLATLQRNAIHAYSMAVAVAMRQADDRPEVTQEVANMFSDFAIRLYASSREPLTMEAFKTDNNLRHFSGPIQGMYTAPAFPPMTPYTVWHLATYLLQRKLSSQPKSWLSHYTLGKVLWKIYCTDENSRAKHPVTIEAVIEAFIEAIETLPERKESRSEYILEPHFKLVSTVHKLVHRKNLTPAQGREYLQATRYSRNVHLSEDEHGPEWEPYILQVLKRIGAADKSNWHHRIIARAAHIIYDEQQNVAGALGAKHEFTQQIFTRTMTWQVWKPEYERAGRHFVYTSRYVSFFVTLLNQLNDRANLESLLRRIKRRATDFLEHQKVWEEVVVTYVKMLRRVGKIPEGQEKIVFEGLAYDEFSSRSEKLEKWAHDPDTTAMVLDILRDAIELKKLNNSLMKGTMLDDLIGDVYASAHRTFLSQLTPEEPPQSIAAQSIGQNVEVFRQTPINVRETEVSSSVIGTSRDPMSVGSLLMSQMDGESDSMCSSAVRPLGLGLQGAPIMTNHIELTSVPAPVKPGRPKQITKREIQRRAEAAIVKPPPIKTPTLPKGRLVVDISAPSRGGIDSNIGEEAVDDPQNRLGTRLDDLRDEGADSTASSRRGSIHDSADDSDLSELNEQDEDIEEKTTPKLMHPGLHVATNTDSEADSVREPGQAWKQEMEVDGEE